MFSRRLFSRRFFSTIDSDFLGGGHSKKMTNIFDSIGFCSSAKDGRDAHVISEDQRLLAVAEGVASWSETGVDSSIYSQYLLKTINNLHQ